MPDPVLERFHRALIEEIQTQRPEYLTQPFTVAEIYQNLVPYGSHRDRIGVEMNGDYEDALSRLLVGEGGYLILDSEPALAKLRVALEAPNPNSGAYRDFAAVDVRLNQAYLDLSAQALDQLPDLVEELEAEDPVTMTDLAPAEGNATATELGVVPPGVDIFTEEGGRPGIGEGAEEWADRTARSDGARDDEGASTDEEPSTAPSGSDDLSALGLVGADTGASGAEGQDAAVSEVVDPDDDSMFDDEDAEASGGGAGTKRRPPLEPEYVEPEYVEPESEGEAAGGSCVWCRADFPPRAKLNYCPFCGTDVRFVPCPACGEEVEPGWRFCVACGAEVEE